MEETPRFKAINSVFGWVVVDTRSNKAWAGDGKTLVEQANPEILDAAWRGTESDARDLAARLNTKYRQ